MLYRIGLDIGVASVGWAAFECDCNGEPVRILSLGSRIFDAAEQPKTGASLAAPRRMARSLRRRLRRRAHRIERVRLLVTDAFGVDTLTRAENNRGDIFEIRRDGLDRALSPDELCRVLVYFVKHRGYSSNSKSEKDSEKGKLLAATANNSRKIAEGNYRTVGEMICSDHSFFTFDGERKIYLVRNKGGEYGKCFLRSDLRDEVKKILQAQTGYGVIKQSFADAYLAIFDSQRSFDEGPALPSKYRLENYPVAKCVFVPTEERAPKAAYTAEYCVALQKINNLRICENGAEYPLTNEQRAVLIKELKAKKELTYAQVKKLLSLSTDAVFNLLNYSTKGKKTPADTEKTRFVTMSGSYEIRKCLTKENAENIALLDELGVILSHCKSDEKRLARMAQSGICSSLSDGEREKLLEVDCKAFGSLSLTAIKRIIPYLEEGQKYNEACASAGFDFRAHSQSGKYKTLHGKEINDYISDVTSPVVRRAVSQTVKVINALVVRYGSPCAVNIELARELAKTYEERKQLERDNDERASETERLRQKLMDDYGIGKVNGAVILKYRLYEEQNGKCAYSGEPLDIRLVLGDGRYTEVDHIIPYSRSFDDSYSNKVLVLASENQNKRNCIPLEYMAPYPEKEKKFRDFVNVTYREPKYRKKRENLLREKFTQDNSKDWKERSLNDTKYATRLVYNLIKDYLEFTPIKGKIKQVFAVSGHMTSYLRRNWGLQKVREEGDKHHAQDAAVIACTTDGMIQRVTRYNYYKERRAVWNDEKNRYVYADDDGVLLEGDDYDSKYCDIREPYAGFRKELEFRLMNNPNEYLSCYSTLLEGLDYTDAERVNIQPVFVSRMPNRKADGAIHAETIRSARSLSSGLSALKTPITALKLNKDGEIENYDEKARRDDRLLYEALRARLCEFGGDGAKAFAEPFYKPKADGTNGAMVKKVWTTEKFNTGFRFPDGRALADNGGMVRVDIFRKGGKYYSVPVYLKDIYAKHLPNRAITAGKPYSQWDEIDDGYEFMFALFYNDLIYLEAKAPFNLKPSNGENMKQMQLQKGFFYYKGINVSTGAASVILHDNSYRTDIGFKTLPLIKKYEVGVLGDRHEIKSEKRLNTEWDS